MFINEVGSLEGLGGAVLVAINDLKRNKGVWIDQLGDPGVVAGERLPDSFVINLLAVIVYVAQTRGHHVDVGILVVGLDHRQRHSSTSPGT